MAERLGLDHVEVTRAVTDAVTRDGDALGRVSRRDRRGDLDRGWGHIGPSAAVQLAQASYSQGPSQQPAAAELTTDDAWRPASPLLTQHEATRLRR